METVEPFEEAIDLIKDAGGDAFKLCFQCGLCTASCPWNTVRTFMPHRMICESRYGLVDLEDESWWQCTTCNQCVDRCPRGVAITDVLGAVRNILLNFEYRMAPVSLRSAMGSLSGEGNPWGGERKDRSAWTKDTGITPFESSHEALYFSCCVPAYDTRLGNVARATGRILQKAGVSFGTLGNLESCCGESVRKAGNREVFESLAKKNIEAFKKAEVKEIITTSPHCYTTFKNDYPELGGIFEVRHVTQVLDRLIGQGEIAFTKEVKKKVVYHDPCYLGRHNGVYDDPREALDAIEGLNRVEFEKSRDRSFCCGGGGLMLFYEPEEEVRMGVLRVNMAAEAGATVIVTACPFCLVNIQDGIKVAGKEGEIEAMDLTLLIEQHLA